MSSTNVVGNERTDRAQASDHASEFEAGEATPELRATVEQEIQGKVDTTHPDAKTSGLTLEAEERLEARELEMRRTRERWDRRTDSDREARTRAAAREGSIERRTAFEKRAASVDPWADPERADPREELSREQLATVNKQATRLGEKLDGWSRAAISRRLAERVVEGSGMMSAVVGVYEELERAPGQVIPIEAVGEVDREEVDIEGCVKTLWDTDCSKIQQVGLIEDETGVTKFTVWRASDVQTVQEGERVRFRSAAKSWYDGRVSVALTGWSQVTVLEEGGSEN